MEITINKNSKVIFDKDFGDVMSLNEFIDCCESGCFIDYDGYARELLLNKKIIFEKSIYPSDLLENKNKFLQLQKELGELEIVWYNR